MKTDEEMKDLETKIKELVGDMPIIMNVKLIEVGETGAYKLDCENKQGIMSYNKIIPMEPENETE